ncbi:hypothetical protein, partial [Neisseria dentiae]|uniref:hypothetical protein n=1 Tax=Neisseria dentiae TaxID=194197 RepID=UPI00211C4B8F
MLKKWIFAVLAALFLSVAYADDKEDAAYSMAVSFCRNKSDTHAVSVSGIQYLCSALKDKTMVDKYGGEYEYLRRGFRCYGGIVCSLDSPESSNVGNVGVWKKRFCIGNWCVYSPTNLTRKSSELQFVGLNEAVAKYENQNGGGNPSSPSNGGGNPSSPSNGGGNPSSPSNGGGNPSSPSNGGGNPSSPSNGGGNPSSPSNGGGNPSSPSNGGGNPSSPPSGNPSSPPSGNPS